MGEGKKMRRWIMGWWALLWSVACVFASLSAAMSLHLHTLDRPVYVENQMTMKEYAALPSGGGKACVLVALENGLGGVVRFTYASNISKLPWRADLLVSVHTPDSASPTQARLDEVDAVTALRHFTVAELEKLGSPKEVVPHRRGAADVGEVPGQPRSATVLVRPTLRKSNDLTDFARGNYAVCFQLIRSKEVAERPQHEQVRLRLVEVASARPSAHAYIAKLSGGDAEKGGGIAEADREYAKMLRSLFRVDGAADLRKLLFQERVVTSGEMQASLDELNQLQKQLFGLYTGAEHLEERYARMRRTAESTYTRIWCCMALVIVVMASSMWAMFYFTKGILIKKKLI